MSEQPKPAAWAVIGDDYEYATLLAEHAGAVAEEDGGKVVPLYRHPQPVAWQLVHENERLRDEIARLREAIRRLAVQDATLSAQGGNVTVTMDATLTDEEREAVAFGIACVTTDKHAATLRKLLERLA